MRPLALLFLLSSPAPLLAQAPDPAELSRRGSELMAAGRYAEAVPVYRDLAKAVPGNAGLIVNLGMALHLSGQDGEAIVPLEAAAWGFKIPIALAVVTLSFAWPLGRFLSREPAIDFPVHNLFLLGVNTTFWVFRIVGRFWLGQGVWALVRAGSRGGP